MGTRLRQAHHRRLHHPRPQDHWIGLARIQEHFPEARGIATPEVAGRAAFEATDPGLSAYWKASFPGELPETAVLPEALTTGEFELEGHVLRQHRRLRGSPGKLAFQ